MQHEHIHASLDVFPHALNSRPKYNPGVSTSVGNKCRFEFGLGHCRTAC